MLKKIGFIFYTESLLRLRRSQDWLYPLGFFVIIICMFPLAFTPDTAFLKKYIPGCVWIAALFASLLSIEHVFQTDIEDGHIEQVLLSSLPLPLLLFIKISTQWLVTEMPFILLTPLLAWLFGMPFEISLLLAYSLLVGTPILTFLGSLMVALTLGLRQPGVLLGLLLLPLSTPVLIFGVAITQQAAAELNIMGPLALLTGLSLLTITLVPLAIAATVRISLDA